MLVDNRSVVIDQLSTDKDGQYCFSSVPKESNATVQVIGQPSQSGGYTLFCPVEPTIDATTQPGALVLRNIAKDRRDLYWIAKHFPASDGIEESKAEGVTIERNSILMQQVQAIQSSWTQLRKSESNDVPSDKLFDNLLETARSDANAQTALTAIRVLMEIGGKGVDEKLVQLRRDAMDVLLDRFVTHPDIDVVLSRGLSGGIPDVANARCLKSVIEQNSYDVVKATASLELAKLYIEVARLQPVVDAAQMNASAKDLSMAEPSFQQLLFESLSNFKMSIQDAREAAVAELNRLVEHASVITVPSFYATKEDGGVYIHRTSRNHNDRSFAYVASHLLTSSQLFSTGKFPPALEGKATNGDWISLDSLRGKLVVVVFTSEWCAPCKAERPLIRKVVEEFGNKQVIVVGVSGDHQRNAIEAATSAGEITWPTLWDGGVNGEIVENWNVRSWPTIVVIDTDGKIATRGISAAALPNMINWLQSAPRASDL